jgi:hypothetical protein
MDTFWANIAPIIVSMQYLPATSAAVREHHEEQYKNE